jgi:general secretion pathway protein E
MNHATSGEIQDLAVAEGMRTMYQDGLEKCLSGMTTLDEVLRVTQET